jgi:hypothetical protein
LAYESEDLQVALRTYNNNWKLKIENEWIPEIISITMGSVRHSYFENSYRRFDDPYPLVNKYFSKVDGRHG